MMDDFADETPDGWLEILNESEAELAARKIVSSLPVHRELSESIARLGAKGGVRQREPTGGTPIYDKG